MRSEPRTGRKDKALGGSETLLLCIDGAIKSYSLVLAYERFLKQLQSIQAKRQTPIPKHKWVSLTAAIRDVACISLTPQTEFARASEMHLTKAHPIYYLQHKPAAFRRKANEKNN